MTEMNTPNEKPLGSAPSGLGDNTKSIYEIKIDCDDCGSENLCIRSLYEAFLVELYHELEKLPETYESKCPNCNSVKTLPSFRWGRYCETPKCNYKLPAPFAIVSTTGSQAEDIASLIIHKFDDTIRCKKCSMPAEHTFYGWVCSTNNCKVEENNERY